MDLDPDMEPYPFLFRYLADYTLISNLTILRVLMEQRFTSAGWSQT